MTEAGETQPCLYQGHVMHMRMTPFAHKFRYRVFSILLDIDHLDQTLQPLRLLSLDRFGLLSFYRRDHGARDGTGLRPWVEAELSSRGLAAPARIWLLSFPRILGYAFNPLSVYFCEDDSGDLTSVVYEVKNTFGDQHTYILPANADSDGAIRHGTDKAFFVSPFIGMDQSYRFTFHRPTDRLSLKIRQHGPDGPWLIATQNGTRHPLTDRALLGQWLRHPAMTFKVVFAIHWQALRLWLKGATFHPYRGPYPDPVHKRVPLRRRIGAALGWNRSEISD